MELFEAIRRRHSYRGPMSSEPVSREDLRQIVQAGMQAPSGRNAQTTEFVMIDDVGILAQLHALHPANKAMQQAPAMIACLVDRSPEKTYEGYDFQLEDCAAAVENMLLAITALGYASVWIDGWLRLQNREAVVAQLLRLPAGKKVQVLLPVGRPEEVWPQKERRPFNERAWFNSYRPDAPSCPEGD
ncbi:MAG: nitroreductase family protein [Desulfuromonadaceae bacterium]|nr:nitroreductase family protein [Desulfuromonadaceae bacterium]